MDRIYALAVSLSLATSPMSAALAPIAHPVAVSPTAATITLNTNTPQAVTGAKTADSFESVVAGIRAQQVAEAAAKQQARVDQANAKLAAAGYTTEFTQDYLKTQDATGTPWQLLAAIHKIESGQRGTTAVASSAGAQGPMQFLPSTFARYAVDADGNGVAEITNVNDAIAAAGQYLAASGANQGNYQAAIFSYNHAQWYVDKVLAQTATLGM